MSIDIRHTAGPNSVVRFRDQNGAESRIEEVGAEPILGIGPSAVSIGRGALQVNAVFLTREHLREILPFLQRFAAHGKFEE